MKTILALFTTLLLAPLAALHADEQPAAVNIGWRRELFVDNFLIEKLTGKAEQRLHHPRPQEIAITHDAPWEGSGSGYHSVFKDGDKYRMYYKAWQLTVTPPGKVNTGEHPLFTCYAESDDGIQWRKPELGLHDFNGSKANNIVIPRGKMGKVDPDGGHPAVFKDENPSAAPDAKYKAIVRSNSPKGLLAMKSPDGLRWSPMADAPVITGGAFDSQNLAFWDAEAGLYRAYWRYFTEGISEEKNWKPAGLRAIRTATSKDFIHWENQHDLRYVDSPGEALYTNQVKPYHQMNFATSAAGDIRVEIQDAAGKPLPGFSLDDCPAIFGDTIERSIPWKSGGDVGQIAGQTVRLRFVLRDADLYSFRFTEKELQP